jgi:hypothetical protein
VTDGSHREGGCQPGTLSQGQAADLSGDDAGDHCVSRAHRTLNLDGRWNRPDYLLTLDEDCSLLSHGDDHTVDIVAAHDGAGLLQDGCG